MAKADGEVTAEKQSRHMAERARDVAERARRVSDRPSRSRGENERESIAQLSREIQHVREVNYELQKRLELERSATTALQEKLRCALFDQVSRGASTQPSPCTPEHAINPSRPTPAKRSAADFVSPGRALLLPRELATDGTSVENLQSMVEELRKKLETETEHRFEAEAQRKIYQEEARLLHSRFVDADAEVARSKTHITSLQTKVTSMQLEIASLKYDLKKKDEAFDNLKAQAEAMSKRELSTSDGYLMNGEVGHVITQQQGSRRQSCPEQPWRMDDPSLTIKHSSSPFHHPITFSPKSRRSSFPSSSYANNRPLSPSHRPLSPSSHRPLSPSHRSISPSFRPLSPSYRPTASQMSIESTSIITHNSVSTPRHHSPFSSVMAPNLSPQTPPPPSPSPTPCPPSPPPILSSPPTHVTKPLSVSYTNLANPPPPITILSTFLPNPVNAAESHTTPADHPSITTLPSTTMSHTSLPADPPSSIIITPSTPSTPTSPLSSDPPPLISTLLSSPTPTQDEAPHSRSPMIVISSPHTSTSLAVTSVPLPKAEESTPHMITRSCSPIIIPVSDTTNKRDVEIEADLTNGDDKGPDLEKDLRDRTRQLHEIQDEIRTLQQQVTELRTEPGKEDVLRRVSKDRQVELEGVTRAWQAEVQRVLQEAREREEEMASELDRKQDEWHEALRRREDEWCEIVRRRGEEVRESVSIREQELSMTLANKDEDLRRMEEEVDHVHEVMEMQAEEITLLKTTLQHRDEELQQVKQVLSEFRAEIAMKEKSDKRNISELNVKCSTLEAKYEDERNTKEQIKVLLVKREQVIDTLREKIATLQEELDRRRNEVEQLIQGSMRLAPPNPTASGSGSGSGGGGGAPSRSPPPRSDTTSATSSARRPPLPPKSPRSNLNDPTGSRGQHRLFGFGMGGDAINSDDEDDMSVNSYTESFDGVHHERGGGLSSLTGSGHQRHLDEMTTEGEYTGSGISSRRSTSDGGAFESRKSIGDAEYDSRRSSSGDPTRSQKGVRRVRISDSSSMSPSRNESWRELPQPRLDTLDSSMSSAEQGGSTPSTPKVLYAEASYDLPLLDSGAPKTPEKSPTSSQKMNFLKVLSPSASSGRGSTSSGKGILRKEPSSTELAASPAPEYKPTGGLVLSTSSVSIANSGNGMSFAESQRRMEGMKSGWVLRKFSFNSGRPVKRWVVLSADCKYIRWGNPRTRRHSSEVKISDVKGISHGASSGAFRNRSAAQDPDWLCFSLLFDQRTLDFAAPSEYALLMWYLGLQFLIFESGINSFVIEKPQMTPGQIIYSQSELERKIANMRSEQARILVDHDLSSYKN